MLEEVLFPWIKKKYDPKKVMSIQDSCSCVKTVQKELPFFFVPSNICPSSSPDLNPCDYLLWEDGHPHNSVLSWKPHKASILRYQDRLSCQGLSYF